MLSLTQTVVRRTPRTLLAGVRFMSDVKADKLIHQAPNRAEVWSDTQQRKAVAMTGPRFEQTNFELQVGQEAHLFVCRNSVCLSALILLAKPAVSSSFDRCSTYSNGGGSSGCL